MYVVTGATGNVGRPLTQALAASGAEVRAVSRNAPRWRADLADPESLRPVVAGAEAFFLLVSGAGAHLDGPAIVDVVKAGGVPKIVLLSSQAAGTRPDAVSHAPLRELERTVRESGLDWVVLRPGGFMSNTFAWAEPVRRHRAVAGPFGDVGLPLVDPADIAGVAAAALVDPVHAGRTYVLTGPELSTPRQRAAQLAEVLGEPVRFTEQTPEQAREQLLTFMPEPVADGTLAILGAPTEQERRISPDVDRVLGRPARTFAAWARQNADAFR
ncbi:NmrA family transcriptional regulator [Actinoplanes ianthinogenes]|uniref:NmrA family transcriptional regulator n=1 Tax=Actinoplanes ianthinogenes TaxID=122358 RepID=A0ABM7LQ14_9ACTN|nr:NAD(P)H-binding protein [Actinoplanes ianthinogenes]BCJ41341.1 NmrA family transcriptional regulator [Actinoplanes ianthinogenes]GGR56307.1 NmrA family transcriptional regulator [Actinoplanes ianthinogenes]